MGQLLSSSEQRSEAEEVVGRLLFDAMAAGHALPELAITHPLLLTNQDEALDTRARLQEQLRQLQADLGLRAPSILRDLVGRCSAFCDEPRLAGLLALLVTMVIDMTYTSTGLSSGATGRAGSLPTEQRALELQELMEEYLKRCQLCLGQRSRMLQDTVRLEAQLSFKLTQLRGCLLGGGCSSRALRQWASGAAFHAQMLVHLAGLQGQTEPQAARAALEQYREDLRLIIPAYRRYKEGTVRVVKCRGGLLGSHDPAVEQEGCGAMTGLTVTDAETGHSASVSLNDVHREIEKSRRASDPGDTSSYLDLIPSDRYARSYLDRLFSEQGPAAQLEKYFAMARDNLSALRTEPGEPGRRGDGGREEG